MERKTKTRERKARLDSKAVFLLLRQLSSFSLNYNTSKLALEITLSHFTTATVCTHVQWPRKGWTMKACFFCKFSEFIPAMDDTLTITPLHPLFVLVDRCSIAFLWSLHTVRKVANTTLLSFWQTLHIRFHDIWESALAKFSLKKMATGTLRHCQ